MPSRSAPPSHQRTSSEHKQEAMLCAICLDELSTEPIAVLWSKQQRGCRHFFHGSCIASCRGHIVGCPVCRVDFTAHVMVPPVHNVEDWCEVLRLEGELCNTSLGRIIGLPQHILYEAVMATAGVSSDRFHRIFQATWDAMNKMPSDTIDIDELKGYNGFLQRFSRRASASQKKINRIKSRSRSPCPKAADPDIGEAREQLVRDQFRFNLSPATGSARCRSFSAPVADASGGTRGTQSSPTDEGTSRGFTKFSVTRSGIKGSEAYASRPPVPPATGCAAQGVARISARRCNSRKSHSPSPACGRGEHPSWSQPRQMPTPRTPPRQNATPRKSDVQSGDTIAEAGDDERPQLVLRSSPGRIPCRGTLIA